MIDTTKAKKETLVIWNAWLVLYEREKKVVRRKVPEVEDCFFRWEAPPLRGAILLLLLRWKGDKRNEPRRAQNCCCVYLEPRTIVLRCVRLHHYYQAKQPQKRKPFQKLFFIFTFYNKCVKELKLSQNKKHIVIKKSITLIMFFYIYITVILFYVKIYIFLYY